MNGNGTAAGAGRFDREFQEQILAFMYQDPMFLAMHDEYLTAAMFDQQDLSLIAGLLFKYHQQYTGPERPQLKQLIWNHFLTQPPLPGMDMSARTLPLFNLEAKLRQTELPSREWASDAIVAHGRRQRLMAASSKLLALLQSDEVITDPSYFDKAPRLIEEALAGGSAATKDLIVLEDDLKGLLERNRKTLAPFRVPTGFERFDKMLGGGLDAPEIGIIAAPPGYGKTEILINFALNCALGAVGKKAGEGRGAVYVTCDTPDTQILNRMAARLTNIPSYLLEQPDGPSAIDVNYAERVDKLFNELGLGKNNSSLPILCYDPKDATVSRIRSDLLTLQVKRKFKPALILIDYPDELRPSQRPGERGEYWSIYDERGGIYEEIGGLCKHFGVPAWVGSQLKGDGIEAATNGDDVAGQNHLAESGRKSQLASVVATVNSGPDEFSRGAARLHICKRRRVSSEPIRVIDILIHSLLHYVCEAKEQTSHDRYMNWLKERKKPRASKSKN